MTIYNDILETVGKTPLVELKNISRDLAATIYGKVESFNPGGSIKDRPALHMIKTAEKQGLITSETTIVEATSGNTGIGLAMVCAVKKYPLVIYMPETASVERRKIMSSFGAEVRLVKAQDGMTGAVTKAEDLAKKEKHVFLTKQFENEANPAAHKQTTALEIWEDMSQQIDVFIACVGTGGTITGVGEKLKELDSKIKIIAVEPAASPVLSGGKPSKHRIEGMGAGFIPKVLNTQILDEIIGVTEEEAYSFAKRLAAEEGIFAGKSAGAAVAAASKYSKKIAKEEKIVVIIPDTGERYLSTDLWD